MVLHVGDEFIPLHRIGIMVVANHCEAIEIVDNADDFPVLAERRQADVATG